MSFKRTPIKEKVEEIMGFFVDEKPNYNYLRSVFRELRKKLSVDVTTVKKSPSYIPSEEEMKKYYKVVWECKNFQDMVIIKTLLYTGVKINEFVDIRISDVDFANCKIRITEKRWQKDRYVPFPASFKEVLGMHIEKMHKQRAVYLFESSRYKKKYTDRGIRTILQKYAKIAGMKSSISPQILRNFLITWLKKSNIDDGLIQSYSGLQRKESLLHVYSTIDSKTDFGDSKEAYDEAINQLSM